MLRHLVAKYATKANGAMLLLNSIQVTESISGSVVPLAMFFISCQDEKLPHSIKKQVNTKYKTYFNFLLLRILQIPSLHWKTPYKKHSLQK